MKTIPQEILDQQTQLANVKRIVEAERKEMLRKAEVTGVGIVHIFNPSDTKGGLTVAFRKCLPEQVSTNMVDVSVAVCSRSDTFSRKIGTYNALEKFFYGEIISLPLSSGYADEDLAGTVKFAFTALSDQLPK